MARACSICHHDRVDEINRMLAAGRSYREVMDVYPRLSHGALSRHKTNHLAPAILDRLARSADLGAERVVSWMVGIVEAAMFEYARCRQDGDRHAAVRFLQEARHGSELLAKVGGHLEPENVRVSIDARQQTAVLASMSEDELRSIVAAGSRELEPGGGNLSDVVEPAPREALTA